MGEDDNFMDRKKPHKSKHSGKLKESWNNANSSQFSSN